MKKKVTLVGAGGKMGMRLTPRLQKADDYEMSYLEVSDAGMLRLKSLGVATSKEDDVLPCADIVIFAVPDVALEKVTGVLVPKMKSGAMVFTLDPACALAGKLMHRDDLEYFIAHPAHPSVFNWEPNVDAQRDFFGGVMAKQTVVCALFRGAEPSYQIGETLAVTMYAPVSKAYRITAGQMGLLEPALVETLSSTCLTIVKEGLEEVIRLGVPREAATEFLLGHLNIQLAVLFDQIPGAVFSDAANKAIIRGKPLLFKDDWKRIFEPENVLEQIHDITI